MKRFIYWLKARHILHTWSPWTYRGNITGWSIAERHCAICGLEQKDLA